MKINWYVAVSAVFFLQNCTPKIEQIEPQSGSANFSRFVAFGDSYMSGYQDGALFLDAQQRSIPALLFSSMKQLGSVSYNQALISDNTGIGISSKLWEGTYITASHLDYRLDCENVSSLKPVKSFHTSGAAAVYLNPLAVTNLDDYCFPFAKTSDFLANDFASRNVYYNRVAASLSATTPLQAALNRTPTFFAAWLGMEDIYSYCRNGGYNVSLPSPAQFSQYLDSILSPLTSQGAKGILATIPNFRSFPFYTLVPYNGADLEQEDADSLTSLYVSFGMPHISFQKGKNGFVIEDPAAPSGYRQMINDEYITLGVPLDSMKCYYYGILVNTIHDRYALDSSEVSLIDATINQYNSIIIQKANQYGLAYADMHSYFNQIQSGIKWNGVDFTAEFVSGGYFSLDGFTVTQKGAALIANKFLQAINAFYGSTLPTINCQECNGVLFP